VLYLGADEFLVFNLNATAGCERGCDTKNANAGNNIE
jgi:hypothetical protein